MEESRHLVAHDGSASNSSSNGNDSSGSYDHPKVIDMVDSHQVQPLQQPAQLRGLHLLYNALYIGLNVSSSVGIVLVNKLIMSTYKFQFGTTLTAIHFIVTAVALRALTDCGLIARKPAPVAAILPLSLAFCGFVVLTNLSLMFNSVGFYQMAKVLTTPVVALIQHFVYQVSFSPRIVASLAVTCVGIAIATFTELGLTLTGLFCALAGVVVTSFYQIWVGTKQRELELNAMQLLYYQAPISAAVLVPCAVIFGEGRALVSFAWSGGCVVAIIVSSLLAVLVNISTFLIIGRTSPITYNMVGHSKLSMILLLGYLFFGGTLSAGNLGGVFLALAGITAYSLFSLGGGAAAK